MALIDERCPEEALALLRDLSATIDKHIDALGERMAAQEEPEKV